MYSDGSEEEGDSDGYVTIFTNYCIERKVYCMQNIISTYQKMNLNSLNLSQLEPQQHLHDHWQKSRNSDGHRTSYYWRILSWWATILNKDQTRNMILILKMDKELVRDFSIKWRDCVRFLKLIALLETTENNFQRLTRSYTKREVSVI